jgi:hypothetical protein
MIDRNYKETEITKKGSMTKNAKHTVLRKSHGDPDP